MPWSREWGPAKKILISLRKKLCKLYEERAKGNERVESAVPLLTSTRRVAKKCRAMMKKRKNTTKGGTLEAITSLTAAL